MASKGGRETIDRLGSLLRDGAARHLTDADLLARFAAGPRDAREAAFAALLDRHGPMVLRTCRGLLGDPHAADDAFQATFVVLLLKARHLRAGDTIGPWLHRVAWQTAARARASAARRARLDRTLAAPIIATDPAPDADLARVVHEELARLAARDRAVVVLCDLEGSTHEQAARSLGCPVGTVKSRLARARARLGDRLRRRGLAPESGSLAPLLGQSIPIPGGLADAARRIAARFLDDGAIGGGAAATIAREVARSMLKVRWMKAATAALLGAAAGVGLALRSDPGSARADDGVPRRAAPSPPLVVPGRVEAARPIQTLCSVPGTRSIVRVLPDGSEVERGQLVCELDPGELWDELALALDLGDEAEACLAMDQILACRMFAIAAGRITLANDPLARSLQIEPGRTVRERQILFSLFRPDDPLVVVARVPAADRDRVTRGQRARIQVVDRPDVLGGKVGTIPELPDPIPRFARAGGEVYSVRVSIDRSPPGLAPGLTARVEIPADR